MCLVEIEKAPKPVASCAMPVMPGMKVFTNTERVKKAREGVMELLLINHPLDCPICDQGGECDLQDQAMMFGSDRSRFTEGKRSVEDKSLGPLVKTVMTRCIHCTRCVRFSTEVAGVPELGVTGRGKDAEIGTYVSKLLTSELSGNVIDVCPVGALTAKPSAFTYRNWELKSTESVDVSDALGANIRVDSRGTEVIRVVPRLNEDVNEEWISDRARFQYDGLRTQRLTVPYVRDPTTGALAEATWDQALTAAATSLSAARGGAVRALAGKVADTESMVALKDMVNRLGSNDTATDAGGRMAHVLTGGALGDLRAGYTLNGGGVSNIDEADAVLLVGSNPRWEAPVMNARLRKAVLNGLPVARVGVPTDLTYACVDLGTGADTLEKMTKAGGRSEAAKWYKEVFAKAKKPMVIVGAAVGQRSDRTAVMRGVMDVVDQTGVVQDGWNGFGILQDTASRVGALDVGFVPGPGAGEGAGAPGGSTTTSPRVVVLLGSDDFDDKDVPTGAFVIYIGHTGEKGAAMADVVLPGASYLEKSATWVNTEGRVQRSKAAVAMPPGAREDWKVVRALSELAGVTLPYDNLQGLRMRMAEIAPHLARAEHKEVAIFPGTANVLVGDAKAKAEGKVSGTPLVSWLERVEQFYQTDVISRTSRNMARCVNARATGTQELQQATA